MAAVALASTDGRLEPLTTAYALLCLHVVDELDLCSLCLDRALLATMPCPFVLVALSVVETKGRDPSKPSAKARPV